MGAMCFELPLRRNALLCFTAHCGVRVEAGHLARSVVGVLIEVSRKCYVPTG